MGHVLGRTNFQRRISEKHRAYNFCKNHTSDGHTSAVSREIEKAFFGIKDGRILVKSLHSHKQCLTLKNKKSHMINAVILSRLSRFLFSGGSDLKVKIHCLRKFGFPIVRELDIQANIIHLRLSSSENYLSIGVTENNGAVILSVVEIKELINCGSQSK